MKVNNVINSNPHKDIAKKSKNKNLPLKLFAKDELSGIPFTGYIKKGHNYYYKTRTKGKAVNERADTVSLLFMEELNRFNLEEKHKGKIEE